MTKYHARRVTVDGIDFDSVGEANRYQQLRLLERAKMIQSLSRQPRFIMSVNGQEVCELRGDFAYFEGGRKVVEDFKGVMTPAFRLKRKLFKALHPDIELRVTNRKGETVNVRTRKASRLAA